MTSASFTAMAVVTASTKRPPAFSGGNRGAQATSIASLKCFPLDPVGAEVRAEFLTGSTREILQTFCQGGLDIKEGDLLVVSGTEYPIRAVEDWYWPPDTADYLRLIIEDKKP